MKRFLKISGLFLLGLILLLIPLFGVYVASAQSLPGEGRYPLKVQSEKIIDSLSAVYPGVYAYFSLLKSQRRYQEVIGLADKNLDITAANEQFIAQIKQTLFDIQSVADISIRLNYLAQYQAFLSNAGENISYKTAALKDTLGVDRTKPIKTFTVDEYGIEHGKLVAKPKQLEQKNIVQQLPVSDELLIININQLERSRTVIENLIDM